MYQRIEEELLAKGYVKEFIVFVKRIKRNNFFQSAFYSLPKNGFLTFKDRTITFFPFKKYNVDYDNVHTFTPDDVIFRKCSISKGSGTPMFGMLTIKHKNKNKDEFLFHRGIYYDTMCRICSIFFEGGDAIPAEDANGDPDEE